MNHRTRLQRLEKSRKGASTGCPRCCPIPTFTVRRLPNGELVQLNGEPIPPACDCDTGAVKGIVIILPDERQGDDAAEELRLSARAGVLPTGHDTIE